MEKQQSLQVTVPDPIELSATYKDIALRSKRIAVDSLERLLERRVNGKDLTMTDEAGITRVFLQVLAKLTLNPFRLAENQMMLWRDYMELWQSSTLRLMGVDPEPVITPDKTDRRFKDDAWEDYYVFDFIKQSYLIAARWLQTTVAGVEGLDEQTARKADFYTRQFVDALAPTNFVLTNPEALRETMQTGGQNLLKGLRNLLEDLERGDGQLNIRMTDLEAFEVGKNIAVTPGKVVFQNEMMQLLQYQPSTELVKKRPLMVVPPWINKFYIMDLRAKNSFIKWLVDQGHTVFVISWVNPTAEYADTDFDDYLRGGTLAALDAIEQATGEREVNALGYCLGGTLLYATLGYLSQVNDDRIQSTSLLTTLIDFSQPGELEVFLDDQQLTALERRMGERGYLEGSEMATSFNLLRANDLIWSFVINNYLLGKDPFPFDLLYWNSDSTRMPAKMHSFYLRNMYQKNLLREPGGISLNGQPIDLSKVKVPVYFLSAIEDHIAPWKSTYVGTQLFAGPVRFVLGASGHIAGVINPPVSNKYHYWTNSRVVADPDEWLADAERHPGSWWNDWRDWVSALSNEQVKARIPGDGKLPILEDAPGTYVKHRLVK